MSMLLVAGSTGVSEMVREFILPANMIMFYLLAVVMAAFRLGFGPSLLSAILGVLAYDFFYVPPRFAFLPLEKQYFVTFGGFLIVAAIISTLVTHAKKQTETIRVREAQTTTLYALSRDLASAVGMEDILQAIIRHVRETMEAPVAILLPEGEALSLQASSDGFLWGEGEKPIALWAFQNAQMAGRGTDRFPSAELFYFPLKTGARVVGVMGMKLEVGVGGLGPDRRRLLEAFSSQAAMAIERANLAQMAEHAQVLQATEKLERSLLNSISHDLRTPLSSIMGALSSLRDEKNSADSESRRELMDLAWEEAGRMDRFIGNLLDITRLEAGALKLKKEPYDMQDLLGTCLDTLEPRLKDRKIKIDIPANLPLIPMDSVLMAQVLINLLDNALKYSPLDGIIEVSARMRESWLEVSVADCGPGIPEEYLMKIFNKFLRLSRKEEVRGTGLGLAISKGIVEAHEGKIWAENRPGGGARIVFTLPINISCRNPRT